MWNKDRPSGEWKLPSPVEGGSELLTDSILGQLNSVNTRSTDTIVHISLFPILEDRDGENWSYGKPLLLLQCHQADHQGRVCLHRAQRSPRKVRQLVASAAKSRHKTVRLKKQQGAPLKPEGNWKQAGQHQSRENFKSTLCPAGTAAALSRATCLLPKWGGSSKLPTPHGKEGVDPVSSARKTKLKAIVLFQAYSSSCQCGGISHQAANWEHR